MALPKIHTRVITKKGKDMIRLLDGRWATVLSENETHITIEVDALKYVGDQGPYRAYDIKYVRTGERETWDCDKRIVNDKRAEITARRTH